MNRNLHYVRVDLKPLSHLFSKGSISLNYTKSFSVRVGGLDPPTSNVSDWHSNRLSYTRIFVGVVGFEPTQLKALDLQSSPTLLLRRTLILLPKSQRTFIFLCKDIYYFFNYKTFLNFFK